MQSGRGEWKRGRQMRVRRRVKNGKESNTREKGSE